MNSNSLLIIAVIFFFGACTAENENPTISYSFFAAGHLYPFGSPQNENFGFYAPFDSNLNYINNYPNLEFGVFTGDVVADPSASYWDSLQVDLNKVSVPYFIAPGNHDRGEEFLKRFIYYYQTFYLHEDLFVILTPTNWNIEGDQLDFLKKTLSDNKDTTNNVFIFLHELIWWSPDNKFCEVHINWPPHYPGSTNYWDEIDPLLRSYPNQIVIFAGDIGCNVLSPCMYYQYDNIILIGSGMGNGTKDNIIFTDVYSDGSFQFNLTHLNSQDKNDLGSIEDYAIEE